MKKLRFSSQFKKDYKRYQHDFKKLEALKNIFILLEQGLPIPKENCPHTLKGRYQGCMECHVGPDFLLIWIDETKDEIYIMRLGSHSELF